MDAHLTGLHRWDYVVCRCCGRAGIVHGEPSDPFDPTDRAVVAWDESQPAECMTTRPQLQNLVRINAAAYTTRHEVDLSGEEGG